MPQTTILTADLATPVNSAFATATTGGTLAAGTYSYRVSAIDGAGGETLASAETAQATTGATSTVTVNWGAVSGATGYKVYGRTAGAQLLIATVGAVTTYVDTGAVTPAGALPVSNNTGTGAAISSPVVVAAGATVAIGIFSSADGELPANAACAVMHDTPGADNTIAILDNARRVTVLSGPGTFRVKRPAYIGTAFGVYSET